MFALTTPLEYLEYAYASGPRQPIVSYNAMFRPFSPAVWMSILGTFIAALIVVYFWHVMNKRQHIAQRPYISKILGFASILLEEPYEGLINISRGSFVILIGIYLLGSLVLSRSYKGNLLARLVAVDLDMEINNAKVSVDTCNNKAFLLCKHFLGCNFEWKAILSSR